MILKATPRMCTRCVMDTSAKNIYFDDSGTCNFCTDFLSFSGSILNKDPNLRKEELDILVAKIKTAGKGKKYDCIVGVSGGVDSSWVLVQAVKLGLRPLAVHMDNGWNSELAQNNIANLVRDLGVDLYTYVIEWNEYRNLMQAFFDADVIDIELLYDNAMLAVNYRLAIKQGVKFILSGCNQTSEGMAIPEGWNWFKLDKTNIKAIAKKNNGTKLKTFPSFGTFDYIWAAFAKKISWLPFLDSLEYNKCDAMTLLQQRYDYKPYPYKHYESIFTRFYQGYILPKKFGIDKRNLHLGTLVASGQMSRVDALQDLVGIPYPSPQALADDKQYFIKKMSWTSNQLDEYLARPQRPHTQYASEKPLFNFCSYVHKKFNKK